MHGLGVRDQCKADRPVLLFQKGTSAAREAAPRITVQEPGCGARVGGAVHGLGVQRCRKQGAVILWLAYVYNNEDGVFDE